MTERQNEAPRKPESRLILIVDDDQESCENIGMALAENSDTIGDHETCYAFDGISATVDYDTLNPDLVILDLTLPKRGGLLVAHHIKKSRKQTPIIMITENTATRHKTYAKEIGVEEYLIKSTGMSPPTQGFYQRLVEAVAKHLPRR